MRMPFQRTSPPSAYQIPILDLEYRDNGFALLMDRFANSDLISRCFDIPVVFGDELEDMNI